MRVLVLEHPRLASREHFNDIANTPLWSCLMAGYAAAAMARAGAQVSLLDARGWSFRQAEERVLAAEPDLLAVHAVYFWEHTGRLFDFLARLKRRGLAGPICLFGFFPSLAWHRMLESWDWLDLVVVGEPEQTLARLVAPGGLTDPGAIAGLAGPRCRRLRPRPPLAHLDRLAPPWRPNLEEEETVSVLASRGCYNRCSFCLVPALAGRGWRGRSVDSVAAEVADLVERGKRDFYFVDPNFIGPGRRGRARARELARALAGLKIGFGMETRAGDLDQDLVEELAAAGLQGLLLGLESAHPAALERMGKNTPPPVNLAAIRAVRAAGLEPEVGFLMFDPQGALEEVEANFAFLQEAGLLDRLSRTANLLSHQQIALLGTPLYARAAAQGRLSPRGVLGFEGVISFRDRRVAWLAGPVRALCLEVLARGGRPESPLYWRREQPGAEPFARVNRFLVSSFREFLQLAREPEPSPAWTAGLLEDYRRELDRLLEGERAIPGS